MRRVLLAALAALVVVAVAPRTLPATAQTSTVVVVAAGDISPEPATVKNDDLRTAELVEAAGPTLVLPLGDEQYEDGTLAKFTSPTGYAASWGRPGVLSRSCPAVGNHELMDPGVGAPGFFAYFGDRLAACAVSGSPGRGFYRVDLPGSGWRVFVLNTDCRRTDPDPIHSPSCAINSAQWTWFRSELIAAHNAGRRCTLAVSHHPRWGSGFFGDDTAVAALWATFVDAHGDLWLAAHEHHYARFGPLDRNGHLTAGSGARQITVGTGGKTLLPYRRAPHPEGLRTRDNTHYGVLRLTLSTAPGGRGSWSSQFQRTDGVNADSVSAGCWV
jgi:calcineurin-like phosphoesterase family protein